MKRIKDTLKLDKKDKKTSFYDKIKDYLDMDSTENKIFHNRHKRFKESENQELIVGLIAVILILLILLSIGYYFIFYEPSMKELENQRSIKINEVDSIFKDDLTTDQTRQAITSRLYSANSVEELESIDVYAMAKPALINHLNSQLSTHVDKYGRVNLISNQTEYIMNVKNASNYINSSDTMELANMSIKTVDTVIIPLNIDRKHAASGLIKEKDIVDIYITSVDDDDSHSSIDNTSLNESNMTTYSDLKENDYRVIGGARVVSILRSKDSGEISNNIELSASNNQSNYSQSNQLDIDEVLSSKTAGTLNESQLNILLSEYGWRLSNYERISNIGDLDVDYIIMLEVPRDSVNNILNNMDNVILTIPVSSAPSWVNLQ